MSKQDSKSAARAIAESAHQIWLAGLGAFARAREEGSRAFEDLIARGAELEKQTRSHTRQALDRLRETMVANTRRLQRSGLDSYAHLQQLIDERVNEALQRLAVPGSEAFRRFAEQFGRLADTGTAGTGTTAGGTAGKKRPPSRSGDRPPRKTGAARKRPAAAKKPAAGTKTQAKPAVAAKRSAGKTTRAAKR